MISGIKRQPRPGPLRKVVEMRKREDLLECGHAVHVEKRRTRNRNAPTRRCDHCQRKARWDRERAK